jgi:hypothetical protein
MSKLQAICFQLDQRYEEATCSLSVQRAAMLAFYLESQLQPSVLSIGQIVEFIAAELAA